MSCVIPNVLCKFEFKTLLDLGNKKHLKFYKFLLTGVAGAWASNRGMVLISG